ncbi:hypothetical protein QWZ13_02600 [Reinekea marina]|uniref:Uncharacterized protein n=1 Tax=Reinekea marina TaxID=1310421 RepID=A0ABV7WNJ1_9GAMM|nr:hypothetical protein [Reinekea marina]MBU2864610.1 hypothetical protein [Reinekea forsetii]MDN3647799.1 hypothetical protein [Reinekea marina]
MLPKPVYEVLPIAYVVGSIIALAVADHFIVVLPVALLLSTAAYIIYLRYHFRHLTARERAAMMSERFKSHTKPKYVRKRHHSF